MNMPQTKIDYYDHPIFNPNQLHLVTPAMKRIKEEMTRWLWTGATGGLITGAARVGKTRALLSLTKSLQTRGKVSIPVYYLSIPQRDQHTIMSIYRQICFSVGIRDKRRDSADHLADRFVHYLADKAVEANCRSAVLIVDEMQHLSPRQFNPFAELYDKLQLLDIALTTVFVGNDIESDRLIETIEQPRYAHIHGRFFRQGSKFLGLVSEKEVRHCLAQYDQLRYPAKGPTYTAFFLPKEVRKGWRLASLSTEIWRVFRDYQKNYKIPSWGMQYFTVTVNTLLSDYLPLSDVEDIDEDIVRECIEISGLIPSEVRAS